MPFDYPMTEPQPNRAVLLLSGGMDSTTLLWWMLDQGVDEIHTVAIDYGQRHRIELESSGRLSTLAHTASHRLIHLDLAQIGDTPLTSTEVDVPAASEDRQISTVIPFRNTMFVTAAAAYAETRSITDLYISPVRDDHAAYRDCRRVFYDALQNALSLGATRETSIRIHTPFVTWSKMDVVRVGLELGVPYEDTHTCYNGTRPACGLCDACVERLAAFEANGVSDPIAYVDRTGN